MFWCFGDSVIRWFGVSVFRCFGVSVFRSSSRYLWHRFVIIEQQRIETAKNDWMGLSIKFWSLSVKIVTEDEVFPPKRRTLNFQIHWGSGKHQIEEQLRNGYQKSLSAKDINKLVRLFSCAKHVTFIKRGSLLWCKNFIHLSCLHPENKWELFCVILKKTLLRFGQEESLKNKNKKY